MVKKSGERIYSSTEKFEKALADSKNVKKDGGEKYVLKLYITGMTRRSQEALRNLEKIGRERLGSNYELEVIDIYQQPRLAKGDQIVAVPTLIKQLPLPMRRLIGDLSREDKIVLGLDLQPKGK
ncbi:MAG TPA: circadian clock KaiB family protein [Dehalococcoidales bacterium]|nr:circadian clock KaiB family protein [Dehalococcoidales bacterium]